jgi:hypothetical protein
MPASAVLDPNDLVTAAADAAAAAASFDPVEFSGLSISMLLIDCSITTLLLCLRWRFDEDDEDERAAVRGRDAAPGPGVLFGGAAAMGTTPFPPTSPLVGVLPAVLLADAEPLAGLSLPLALLALF